MPQAGTYAWAARPASVLPEPGAVDPTAGNTIVRARIERGVDRALAIKGYQKTDPQSADFLVRYAVGIRTTTDTVTQPYAPGMQPTMYCGSRGCWSGWDYGYWGPQDYVTREVETREAGFILDLVDRKSGNIAWRGVYKDEAKGRAPSEDVVNDAMLKLTKSLPAVKRPETS